MSRARGLPRALAGRAARLVLFGAVVFWWVGIVFPWLIGLSSSSLLPLQDFPRTLDPAVDGSLANAVSAGALATLALVALASAIVSQRRASSWIAIGGWLVVALAAALLAWDEMSDFHVTGLTDLERTVFSADLLETLGRFIWVLLLSPLIAAFLLAMGVFIVKGLPEPEVRVWLGLGLAAWILVLALEISTPVLLVRVAQSEVLGSLLEETLEFSGAVMLSLGAVRAIRGPAGRNDPGSPGWMRGRALLGWGTAMAILASVLTMWVIRVPLVDARGPTTHVDAFAVSLRGQEAAVQELRMPAAPVSLVRLRVSALDPSGRGGRVGVRFTRLGTAAPELSGGVGRVADGQDVDWLDIELVPALAEPEGQPLAMWVVADMDPAAELLVGASKTNPYPAGGLWINGVPTWPDQDLEFVLYSAGEPTLGKARAFRIALAADWTRLLAVVELTIALLAVVMSPALLITAALPARPTGWPGGWLRGGSPSDSRLA